MSHGTDGVSHPSWKWKIPRFFPETDGFRSFSHRVVILGIIKNFNGLGIVNDAILDRIRNGIFPVFFMPAGWRELRAKNSRRLFMPRMNDLQEIKGFGFIQGHLHPLVQNPRMRLLKGFHPFLVKCALNGRKQMKSIPLLLEPPSKRCCGSKDSSMRCCSDWCLGLVNGLFLDTWSYPMTPFNAICTSPCIISFYRMSGRKKSSSENQWLTPSEWWLISVGSVAQPPSDGWLTLVGPVAQSVSEYPNIEKILIFNRTILIFGLITLYCFDKVSKVWCEFTLCHFFVV